MLQDPQCSRIHAELYHCGEGWWVRDNKSSNGTFVNGQSVDEARLVHQTELRIGGTVFLYEERTDVVSDDRSSVGENDLPRISKQETLVIDPTGGLVSADGSPTMEFLKGHDWGKDFFFLFQLSVKLLSLRDREQLVKLCVQRLVQRSLADSAGFLWVADSGELKYKYLFPEASSDLIKLDQKLTARVLKEHNAIRTEYDTNAGIACSICVPLICDQKTIGIIHLYRRRLTFSPQILELSVAVAHLMAKSLQSVDRFDSLKAEHTSLVQKSAAFEEIIGESPQIVKLKDQIARVAPSSGSVLLRGESGSGKELAARAIHRASPRADRPMLSINCAAVPRELMDSQLFGHRKGAFTSADRDHVGWFQQADMGTLFLDEIGELSLEGQAKLLRVLEGHPFLPLGSTKEVSVDVRVICATNRDLREQVKQKQFREDLYYRLSVYELVIPPLRERAGDIEILMELFLQHFKRQHGRPQLTLAKAAKNYLIQYAWPGNIRQLRNVIDSAIIMADSDEIKIADLTIQELDASKRNDQQLDSLKIDHWEQHLIKQAMQQTGDNIPQAAVLLGVSRATLYRKLQQYQIEKN